MGVAGTAAAVTAVAVAAVRGAAAAVRAVTGIDTAGRAFVTQRSAPAGVGVSGLLIHEAVASSLPRHLDLRGRFNDLAA
jgi:hypothetical protein